VDDFIVTGNEQLLVVLSGKCWVTNFTMFMKGFSDPVDKNFNLSHFIITDLDALEIPTISVSWKCHKAHLA